MDWCANEAQVSWQKVILLAEDFLRFLAIFWIEAYK
jgi:hypothetical protein